MQHLPLPPAARLTLITVLSLCLATGIAVAGERHSGLDLDGFDAEARPQDDLYQHAGGRWLMLTDIPEDKSNYGAFTALDDAARENIRTIIEQAASAPTDGTSAKVGAFYRSFMDVETIESRGLSPIRAELETITALPDRAAAFAWTGYLQSIGINGPAGFFVGTDAADSDSHLAAIVQSGTTLPDRDYYLKDDAKYLAARTALQEYVQVLFRLAELPDGNAAATAILALESSLAEVQWTRTELRDAEKRYNKYQTEQLQEQTPNLPWAQFLDAIGVPQLAQLNVMTPSYFDGLNQMLNDVSLQHWKYYLQFRVLDAAAPWLSEDFAAAHFNLHRRQLAGVPEQEPRWKRAVAAASGGGAGDFGVLGEAIGQLYVQRHFQPAARERMDQLVANLLTAYRESMDDLTWMTDATKQKALEKLSKIRPKIGHPQKWRDYSTLEIHADDLLGNMRRSAQFEHQRSLAKLGTPVDKDEWGMTPQTVNAYYNPAKNEIVFPAAILQPPFFDATADDAVNYGAIGAVIGHEISHGFDDQGSRYDGDGNLRNWWTDEDRAAFEALTSRLVEQFEQYEPLPGRHLNGRLTLGENIADLSGLSIAWKAWQLSLAGEAGKEMDRYTAAQRFFLGWAQVWRRKYRESEMIRRLVIDPHSPSQFRANGPVINMDAFHDAFQVKPGDQLYQPPEQRIQIW